MPAQHGGADSSHLSEAKRLQKQTIVSSCLFDPAYYVRHYPSAVDFSSDPLDHYLELGARSGYNPHPLFNTSFYTAKHPECVTAEMNPLYHYLVKSSTKRCDPHPLFDSVYYETQIQEAHPSNDLLSHYLTHWSIDYHSPHPLFDIAYYLEQYPEVILSGYDPISHYLEIGAEVGYNPHPLFDTAFYYQTNADVKEAGVNALVHYLECGGFEGRDPHPWFDSSYYNESNPDVVNARGNPLMHYVQFGGFEKRSPHPLFRSAHWEATHGTPQMGHKALVQFASELRRTGQHPLVALRFRDHGQKRLNITRNCTRPGVNLIGWPRLEIGVGECLREIVRTFASTGYDFGVRDVSLMQPTDAGDDSVTSHIVQDCAYQTNLFVLNADNMLSACERLGFEAVKDRFNIAMWAWELSEFPSVWRQEMSVIDEFWAISAFTQQAVSMKAEVPVVHMPQPITLSSNAGLVRVDFGVPDDRFLFLFQFDFSAFIDRKNPYATIAAFRKAFPQRNAGAALVIKTNNSERHPEQMRQLLEAVGNDPDIMVLNGTFCRDKVMSLMAVCDAFVSLHRSEGFGRSLAEAMLMGKPVISTGYSGNTDFMRPDNSCPVNYTLVPVKEGQYPHASGQVWAEPDIDHAAWYMRRLMHCRDYRQLISSAARQTVADNYSLQASGTRYLRRLRILGLT
jgi:glycosyltransferase involved in cell wall biosynthesis